MASKDETPEVFSSCRRNEAKSGQKLLALYPRGKRYYPAVVTCPKGKRSVEVEYIGFDERRTLPLHSLISTRACQELADLELKSGTLTAKTEVYARFSDDNLWYYAFIQGASEDGYEVKFDGFSGVYPCSKEQVFSMQTLEAKKKESRDHYISMRNGDGSKSGSGGDSKVSTKGKRRPRVLPKAPEVERAAIQRMSELEEKKKEGSANFYLSLTDEKVSDMMSPILGLYKCGVPARYGGNGGFPSGEILALVHAKNSVVELSIPGNIKKAISLHFSDKNPEFAFEFVWCVSQISDIFKPKEGSVNFVHHAWVFPDIQPGQRRQCETPFGVFNLSGDGTEGKDEWRGIVFKPEKFRPNRDMSIGECHGLRVSVHADKRNKYIMCCSPNNGKIYFMRPNSGKAPPLIAFWSAAVEQEAKTPRVLVQLNWLYTQESPLMRQVLQECVNLKDIKSKILGDEPGTRGLVDEAGGEAPFRALRTLLFSPS